eukprot:5857661-Pyramimonas_sp.AAC.1
MRYKGDAVSLQPPYELSGGPSLEPSTELSGGPSLEPSTGAAPTPDCRIREASLAPFGKPA